MPKILPPAMRIPPGLLAVPVYDAIARGFIPCRQTNMPAPGRRIPVGRDYFCQLRRLYPSRLVRRGAMKIRKLAGLGYFLLLLLAVAGPQQVMAQEEKA